MERLNAAHTALVLKKSEAIEVGDFRPISVRNTSVKIIYKVLANRLREVLGDIIYDHQT